MTRNTEKQKVLLQQDRRIFCTSDLAVLWNITNKNTLLTTVKRYIKRGILNRIQRGLYSITPIQNLHPYELGCAVAGPSSYVSTETILQNDGIIMQNVPAITLVGTKRKTFTFNNTRYLCRYLNSQYLLNREGIIQKDNYSIATTARAAADILHINPDYYFDNESEINNISLQKIKSSLDYK